MNLTIVTYNVNRSKKLLENMPYIFGKIKSEPDLIFITLQEVLSPFIKQRLIDVCKQKYSGYNIVCERYYFLISLVITKNTAQKKLKMALGPMGLPNKGFIAIQVDQLLLIGCHLPAGEDKTQERLNSIKFIFENTNKYFKNVNAIVFAGDMNFRMKNNDNIKNMINDSSQLDKDTIKTLMVNSEDSIFKSENKNFEEKEIEFKPTYKYNGNTYNTERMPSWCDRIFFDKKGSSKVDINEYRTLDLHISDHKPVLASATLDFEPLTSNNTRQINIIHFRSSELQSNTSNCFFFIFIRILFSNFCRFVHENLLLVVSTIVFVCLLMIYKKINR